MFRSDNVMRQLVKAFPLTVTLIVALIVGIAQLLPMMTLRGIPFLPLLIVGTILAVFVIRVVGWANILYCYAAVIWLRGALVGRIFQTYFGVQWLDDVELGIYIGTLITLASDYRHRRLRDNKPLTVIPLLPLLIFVAGGCLAFLTGLAPNEQEALYRLRTICFYPLAIYFLVTKTIRHPEQAERLIRALCLGGCILGLAVYAGWIGVESPLQATAFNPERLGGSFSFGPLGGGAGSVSLGGYLSCILPLALSLGLHSHSRLTGLFGFTAWGGLAILLILTGSRMPWIAGASGCLLVAFLTARHSRRKTRLVSFVFISTLVLLLVASKYRAMALTPAVQQRMTSLWTAMSEDSFLIRVFLWRTGFDLVKSNPWGTGFIYILPDVGFNPHSLYLGLALGTGVIGLFGLAWFIVFWLRRCVAALKSENQACRAVCIGAIGTLLATILWGIVDDIEFVVWFYAAVWVVLSAARAAYQSTAVSKYTKYK